MWDHMAGGGFAAYDAVLFKIVVPEEKRGQEVRVYFESGSVAATSSLRRPEARFRFDFDFALLKQGHLFGGALENLELVTAGVAGAQTMQAANSAVLAKIVGELARLEAASKEEKLADGFPPSRQAAYYLLAGLAKQGVAMTGLSEADQRAFDVEPRGGTRAKLVSVFTDVRVALVDRWIQDKSGSYVHRAAILYVQQDGKWVEKGTGTVAASEYHEP